MKTLLLTLLVIITTLLLSTCGPSDHSENALEDMALQKGRLIADSTQKVLASNLGKAMKAKGITHAIDYCNTAAMPLTRQMEETFDAPIKRTTLKLRNPDNKPDSTEASMLHTYDSLMEKNQSLEAYTHWKDENTLMYFQPIQINNSLCLNCHGTVGATLTDTVYGFIKDKYPADEATGYELGDFRGMWSIAFPREKLEALLADQ